MEIFHTDGSVKGKYQFVCSFFPLTQDQMNCMLELLDEATCGSASQGLTLLYPPKIIQNSHYNLLHFNGGNALRDILLNEHELMT